MNIAVLSDIHGNYIALQRCMEYAIDRGIEMFVFLGDYLGELAYPQKTMDMLYSLQKKKKCIFIRGNKEDYWITHEENGEKGWKEYDSTTGALYYTYSNLREEDMEFFKSLPFHGELTFDGLPSITICHGSPRKANEKLLPDNENTFSVMEDDRNGYILCGHTHVQGVIEHNGKLVLNAGAVGVSLHGNGMAQFLILQEAQGKWDYEFVSLEYDRETVIAELYSAGLVKRAPSWCKVSENLLRTGEVSHGSVLARAMELCREKNGECNWPAVPEECWKDAVNEMINKI